MIKNFITLGDAAFDANDAPMGIIRFTPDNVSNWKNIALEQLKSVKTERISQFAKEGGAINISGLFYAKNKIAQADFDDFCGQVAESFGIPLLGRPELSSSRHREDNEILISLLGTQMREANDWFLKESMERDN